MDQQDPADTEETQTTENNSTEPAATAPIAESMRVLEALIFASDEILTTDRLKTIVPGQPDARKIRQMVDKINIQLQKERHPFEIAEVGGGYQFRTVAYYYQWVQQLFKEKTAKKLSIQSLECLAIIAYKQPITKAEIEAIRGVLSDGAMKTLLEKHLVTISGRSDKAGRPLLYATTKEFLGYFGLNKLADLPRVEEFEAMAKEKLGDLSQAELEFLEKEKPVDPELDQSSAKPADGNESPIILPSTEAPENPIDLTPPTPSPIGEGEEDKVI